MSALEDIVAAAMSAPPERREAALRVLRGDVPRAEEYLTLADVATRLGYCPKTLRRWQVPSHRHGGNPRYRLSEVEAYLGTEAFQRRLAALRAERRNRRSLPRPPFGNGHRRVGLFASLTPPGVSNANASSNG